MRPYAYYCSPTDVANLLQMDVDFDETTNPSRSSIEDYIRAAQSRIDYTTQKSWRLNYKIDEEYGSNITDGRTLHGFGRKPTRKI